MDGELEAFIWVADNQCHVTAITPATGKNNETLDSRTLRERTSWRAQRFQMKKGTDIVNATTVVVVSATKITCTFDLTGKAVGQWDVQVFSPFSTHAGHTCK